jgi:hypothetical protein
MYLEEEEELEGEEGELLEGEEGETVVEGAEEGASEEAAAED